MRSVVVCASKRFAQEVRVFCDALESAGVVVFRPNIDEATSETTDFGSERDTRVFFKGVTLEHFEYIRKADVCFMFNKGGYIGTSVTLELGFAQAMGMPIYSLEKETGDPCTECLMDGVVPTPELLLKKLN